MADRPCSSPEARQFDFWLGEWDLAWPAEQTGGTPGEVGIGSNRITRLFDDCVIEENFNIVDGSLLGHSVSVYDERDRLWRQTWVDSAGGYLWLTGGMDEDMMVLSTEPREWDGEMVTRRMVFSEITEGSLEWVWQSSRDEGATWSDLWNISYRRRT